MVAHNVAPKDSILIFYYNKFMAYYQIKVGQKILRIGRVTTEK